ncbi:hypothetical protein [Cloacibacillus evryensis]|uniref:hypothetical protein n=1 Tax=Cloacibacillus evryensis TaxID=508460 RepID=UPI00210CA4F4|nr:hypothetical protein [Cloacibacillus evryensis]MCQ4763471.1 hypothetical protein [Cloacibacillus evryensis]
MRPKKNTLPLAVILEFKTKLTREPLMRLGTNLALRKTIETLGEDMLLIHLETKRYHAARTAAHFHSAPSGAGRDAGTYPASIPGQRPSAIIPTHSSVVSP